ncbi:MAG: hypothetical protein JWM86_423, partial [Thermoleophilia bacterium]|nr:hypothetical protein [Thermoleophilia bacterium]
WALLFISFLVLLPADNFVSRAAVRSVTGGLLVRQEGALRWLSEGFPHYTQQLPKGKLGVVVGERGDLPMRGSDEPEAKPRDTEQLVRIINRVRAGRDAASLTYNPDIAGVAERQAMALAAERVLSYRSPTGAKLDDRVRAALGENAASFEQEIGIEVVWAHSPANAGRGLDEDARASRLLRDEKWSEVGVGIADAGWFNGRIYVIMLVAAIDADAEAGADAAGGDADADADVAGGELPVEAGP